jgi:hypothetical protein
LEQRILVVKKTLSLVCFYLVSFSAFSQENVVALDKQSYVSISVGSSIPLQDFKSTYAKNINAGFAKSGKKYDIFWAKNLKKSQWSVTGLFRFHSNPIDNEGLELVAKNTSPANDFTISANDWKLYTLMGGAYYRIKSSKRFTLMPKAMLGVAYIYSPDVRIVANGAQGKVEFSSSKSSYTLTPSYLFSIGLKRNLYKNIILMSNFDFLGAFPTFSDMKTTYANGTSINRTITPSFLTFNYGFAMGYEF